MKVKSIAVLVMLPIAAFGLGMAVRADNTIFVHTLGGGTTEDPGYVWNDSPQKDGDLTVLTRHDGNDREVFVYDISLGVYGQITNNDIDDRYPRINGNQIAWVCGEGQTSEILLASYVGGQWTDPINVSNNSHEDNFPHIRGNYLVWQGHVDDNWEIFLHDINHPELGAIQITHNDYDDISPQTDGFFDGQQRDYVVWLGFNGAATVDNMDLGAGYTGDWYTSTDAAGYYGENYHYHEAGSGGDRFTWTPNFTAAGTHTCEVFAHWASNQWATDATYTIHHDGGTTDVVVNQSSGGGTWVSLGTYSFDGTDDYLELSENPNGPVCADAIRFLPPLGGEIFLYDISSAKITKVTNDYSIDSPPQTANGQVVWTSHPVTRTSGGVVSSIRSVEPGEVILYGIEADERSILSETEIVDPYNMFNDGHPRINSEKVIWVQTQSYPESAVDTLVPNSGAYGTTIKVKGSGFAGQQSGMINDQVGHYSFITFSGTKTVTVTKYPLWSDAKVKVKFKKLFDDANGNHLQDIESLLTVDELPLGNYSLTVNTIWFHDLNPNGIYDAGDQIYKTFCSNSQVFQLTDEPIIYFLNRVSTPATAPGTPQKVKIIGLNFGETQDTGTLHIGGKTWSVGHPKITIWTDDKIKFKVPKYQPPFPKYKDVWVTVNGKDSNKLLLEITEPIE